jgi:hypothetical protein
MKKKVVLVAILVVPNLFLGSWIDRTWFRGPTSGPTHTLVPEQPLPGPEPSEMSRTDSRSTIAPSKDAEAPPQSPLDGRSVEFKATAVEWAQRISEAKLRDEALARTVQDWLQIDPIAAGAWLNATPLGEGIKERALNPKKK